MRNDKRRLIIGAVLGLFVLSSLACVFPAEVTIDKGLLPTAFDEDGYAMIDIAKAGCDCDTSVVTGKVKYRDGTGPDKVQFNGTIECDLSDYCEIPQTGEWAEGPYSPGDGTFHIGLYGNTHESFDWVNCAGCSADNQQCWRLWLVGGKFDGYENWACELENTDALAFVEHPEGSPCAQ